MVLSRNSETGILNQVQMNGSSSGNVGTDRVVALGSDHAGYLMKDMLRDELASQGYKVLDLGTNGPDSVDYPDFGAAVAEAVAGGKADCGVVVCGSGIGISIAANRNPGARAALCHSGLEAQLSRLHNDANILALGARIIGEEAAKDCLRAFLDTDFEGGRHARRVAKLGSETN
jgi:ribose 5-phosphate isomerase B